MEPFGLLDFLQSILAGSPKNNEDAEESPRAEEVPAPLETSAETPRENTKNQEAILSFLDEHERRAKNVRK